MIRPLLSDSMIHFLHVCHWLSLRRVVRNGIDDFIYMLILVQTGLYVDIAFGFFDNQLLRIGCLLALLANLALKIFLLSDIIF